MSTDQLLQLAREFGRHKGLKLSTVGAYTANDGKFFLRIAGGAGCTLNTAMRICQWFSDNWPPDLEWPSDIPRPAPVKSTQEASSC
ncbi:hypothetical protein DU478_17620 [Thalassococcus profundi]|uniref:XRE family transcriptional regulator n=1 Tax=Thalassococcus profundi TaxID=2282382 RepID=A0A369TIF4_9RHOB|nr:hypothetical protein DU478_17620 [Thalassococcus profundi]